MLSETTEHAPCKQGGRGAKAELVTRESPHAARTGTVLAQDIAEGEAEQRRPVALPAASTALSMACLIDRGALAWVANSTRPLSGSDPTFSGPHTRHKRHTYV